MQSLGTALKTARLMQQKTQEDIGTALGVTKSYVCDVETDRRDVTPAMAAKWCAELQLDDTVIACLSGRLPDDVTAWLLGHASRIQAVRDVMKRGTKVTR